MIRRLGETFPREAIKQRQGGRGKMLSYLDGATVIRRLNYATDNTWDFVVLNEERVGNLLSAYVALTIPGLGTRQHKGVQRIEANAGEDIEKGAITDALKKAATLFGVGLETYADEHDAAPPAPAPRARAGDDLVPHEWRGRLDFDSDNPNANRPKGKEILTAPAVRPAEDEHPAWGWSEAWAWLRQEGINDQQGIVRALGGTYQGWTPGEIVSAIEHKEESRVQRG